MQQELRDCDPQRWRDLADLLTRRRIELSSRYVNRAVFAREKTLNYRLVYDIERHRRQDYGRAIIILIERCYSLPDGFIRQFLTGQTDSLPAGDDATAEAA